MQNIMMGERGGALLTRHLTWWQPALVVGKGLFSSSLSQWPWVCSSYAVGCVAMWRFQWGVTACARGCAGARVLGQHSHKLGLTGPRACELI